MLFATLEKEQNYHNIQPCVFADFWPQLHILVVALVQLCHVNSNQTKNTETNNSVSLIRILWYNPKTYFENKENPILKKLILS